MSHPLGHIYSVCSAPRKSSPEGSQNRLFPLLGLLPGSSLISHSQKTLFESPMLRVVLQFSAEPFGFFLFQTAGRCDRSPIGQLQFKVVPHLVARLKIRSELKVLNRGSRDHARSRDIQTSGADTESTAHTLTGTRGQP